jgi:hypothetical protein
MSFWGAAQRFVAKNEVFKGVAAGTFIHNWALHIIIIFYSFRNLPKRSV